MFFTCMCYNIYVLCNKKLQIEIEKKSTCLIQISLENLTEPFFMTIHKEINYATNQKSDNYH